MWTPYVFLGSLRKTTMPRVVFNQPDGSVLEVNEPAGLSILEIAHKYGVDIEGACEASLACSTCHVIVDPDWHDRLPPPTDDEEDMLDLAWGVTETSRLGCQVELTEQLDGLVLRVPGNARDARG